MERQANATLLSTPDLSTVGYIQNAIPRMLCSYINMLRWDGLWEQKLKKRYSYIFLQIHNLGILVHLDYGWKRSQVNNNTL